MPDFGTLITDARGILHDVSKHGFDAFRGALSDPMNITDTTLSDSFTTTFSLFKEKLGEKYGINVEDGISLEDLGQQLKEQLVSTGGRMAAEAVVGYALTAATELAIEGPLGLIVTEGLTIISSELIFALTKGTEYKTGQWVFIDYGLKNRLINAIPKVVEFGKTFDWSFSQSGFMDVPDDLDYKTEAKHAIGFILEKEDSGYEWSVFSFLTGKEEKLHEDKLRPCPESFATKLDADPDFSQVREVLFLKEHDPTLRSYIPTNPGEIVIYQGSPYVIVTQSGNEWFVKSSDGTTIRCTEQDLMPGKTLTSQRWENDKLHLGGYEQDGFFSGEWVWIPAGDFVKELIGGKKRRLAAVPDALSRMQADNKILGLVKTIEGRNLEVVRAYDGKVLMEDWGEISPASESVQGLLNRDKYCGNWRFRVLEGANPTQVTPGESRPMLTLGLGELSDESLQKVESPEETPIKDRFSAVAEGVEGVADVIQSEQISKADEMEDALMLGDGRYEVHWSTEEDRLSASTTSSGGGSGAMLLVVGALVLWTIYS
jgi:hypothetical protein